MEVIVLLVYLFRSAGKKLGLHFSNYFHVDPVLTKDYLKTTAPMLVTNGLWGVNTALQTVILGHMTAAAIAANSVASTLYMLIKSTAVGASSTASVMIGKAVGSGDIPLTKHYSKLLQRLFLCIGVLSGITLFFIRIPILSIYDLQPATKEMANTFLIILSVICVGMTYQMPTNNGIIRGGGDTKFLMIADILFLWAASVPLGALAGRSEYQLEVLKDSDAKAVERGKRFIEQGRIDISLKEGITEKLYIEIEVSGGGHSAVAIIAGGHTNFVFISRDGETLQESRRTSGSEQEAQGVELNLRKVFDFAMTTPLDEIRFILEAKRLNKAAAEDSFKNNYGHCVGNTLRHAPELRIIGDCALSRILSYTCAACDARMAGAMVPVMSNSGSGNQGIATTLPVVVYAEEIKADEEHLVRALVLSHLTAIYIKQSLGRLSALCGCVVAATGSSCGITYLMGGGYEAVSFAVKNMIANLTGMMCDGAKPSCSLKLMTGVSTAVLSAMLAMENHSVSSVEGIIDDDVDKSIRNLTLIGRDGMNETDHLILKIMTSK